MNTWYWYVARENELLIDCDKFSMAKQKIRERLKGAIECRKLYVEHVHVYDSMTRGHAHIVIELENTLPHIERTVWEILFYSDIYRACCNIFRYERLIGAPSVLITTKEYHRAPDHICHCESKHTRKIMNTCPVAADLRGPTGKTATFFGKPSKNPCDFLL